jgi:hypothetical protein
MTASGRGLPLEVGPRKLPLGHPVNLLLSAYGLHVELTLSAKSGSWRMTAMAKPNTGEEIHVRQ